MKISTLIHADTGQDDAVAILLALATTRTIGIVSSYGNCSLDDATRNCLDLLAFTGNRNVSVARGAAGPLFDPPPPPSPIHGPRGLGDTPLPACGDKPVDIEGPEFTKECVEQSDEPVTIVSLGPLTTLAESLRRYPEIAERIERICIMGGSATFGNVTPVAEFNVHADPEAAAIVFGCGAEIRMIGLNITRFVSLGKTDLAQLQSRGGPVGGWLARMLTTRGRRLQEILGVDSLSIHDPCAVLAVTRPELFSWRQTAVHVETAGDYTRGMTVCDLRPGKGIPGNDMFEATAFSNIDVAIDAQFAKVSCEIVDTLVSYFGRRNVRSAS